MRDVFEGQILGVGSTSGVRVVVGRWLTSPLGAFSDCMVESADGHRTLVAPSAEVAEYVAATYSFDAVCRCAVSVSTTPSGWTVDAGPLQLTVQVSGRTALGRFLSLVPAPLASHPVVATLADPIARATMRGVRTRGTAGGGRREYYGATDMHAVAGIEGTWDGVPLGELRPVDPAPRFGFSSTPRQPSVVDVVTTVVRTV